MNGNTARVDTKEIRSRLSRNLKKYRKLKRLSQFELAEKADISEQTMNSIEGMRLWPSDKTLAKIAGALGVDLYALFLPETLAVSSESFAELKRAVAATVESLVRDALGELEVRN